MKKVFLSGTTNGSTWRDELIKLLKIDYFNPKDFVNSKEIIAEQFELCDYILYMITPKMSGFYNLAQAVDLSNKNPKKLILCILLSDKNDVFGRFQIKSLNATSKLIENNGSKCFKDIQKLADYLNKQC